MGQHVDQIQRVYDLKGSLHRRDAKKISNSKTVRKDLNFLRDTDVVMKLPPSIKSDLKKRMFKDKEFLKKCGLMDYSLLLIVFSKKEYVESEQEGFVNVSLKGSGVFKSLFLKSKDSPLVQRGPSAPEPGSDGRVFELKECLDYPQEDRRLTPPP